MGATAARLLLELQTHVNALDCMVKKSEARDMIDSERVAVQIACDTQSGLSRRADSRETVANPNENFMVLRFDVIVHATWCHGVNVNRAVAPCPLIVEFNATGRDT